MCFCGTQKYQKTKLHNLPGTESSCGVLLKRSIIVRLNTKSDFLSCANIAVETIVITFLGNLKSTQH